MERVLREAYDARMRGDLDGVMAHFSDDAAFCIAGCPTTSAVPLSIAGATGVRDVLGRMIASFTFHDREMKAMIVEGNMAAVQWRMRISSPATGEEVETEFVDILRFEGDKVASLTQFADTALVGRLLGS